MSAAADAERDYAVIVTRGHGKQLVTVDATSVDEALMIVERDLAGTAYQSLTCEGRSA